MGARARSNLPVARDTLVAGSRLEGPALRVCCSSESVRDEGVFATMDSHKHAGLLAGGFTLAVAATGCRALGALHMCVNRPLVVARTNLTLTPRASARAPRPPKGTAITRTRRSRS